MGIGNEMMGDDFIGSWIARKFKKNGWVSIDCGTAPENFTSMIKRLKPEKVVIVDSADMGLKAGEIRIVEENSIDQFTISSHSIPLSLLVRYLKEFVKHVIIIGIQPKKFDGGMSREVRRAGEELIKILKEGKEEKIKKLTQ